MSCKFKMGDMVTLNDEGLRIIGGLTSRQMIADSELLVVTDTENINPPKEDEIWLISTNKPSINKFLLSEDCLIHLHFI